MDLKFEYPPPCERLLEGYKKVYASSMNQVIKLIDQDKHFSKKSVAIKVSELRKIALKYFFQPKSKSDVLYDDKDHWSMKVALITVYKKKNGMESD